MLNDDSRKVDFKKASDKDAILKEIQGNLDRLVSKGGRVNVEYKAALSLAT